MNRGRGRRSFRPGWGLSLAVMAMLPVLLALGVWQLQRAEEKRSYQSRYYDRLAEPPRPLASLAGSLTDAGFARVFLRGRYQRGRDYLVDNRTRHGRPGYWVVSRFAAQDGRIYLVNRGWIAAPPRREVLPEVVTPGGPVTLQAVVWPDLGLPPLLAEEAWPSRWPKRIQRLDVARMAADPDLGPGIDSRFEPEPEPVVAAELRLEPGQAGVFVAAPVDPGFVPERHQAYAAQWFGLALVLLAGYVILGFRLARDRTERGER